MFRVRLRWMFALSMAHVFSNFNSADKGPFHNLSTYQMDCNNTTVNEVDEDMKEELSLVSKVFYGIIISIMIIVCITGNILTLLSYAQDRKLRTVHNTYLISLAASDLLVGCVSMPFYAVYTLMSYSWPFGVTFCKVFMSIDFLACLESVFVIMLVSYDRCMLLVQGASYTSKQTMRAAKVRIFLSWTVSFLAYVPAIAFWDVVRGFSVVEEGDCDVEFYEDFSFIMVTSAIEFFMPLIIIACLNIYLYSLILKRSRRTTGQKLPQSFNVRYKKDQLQAWVSDNVVAHEIPSRHGSKDNAKYINVIKRERKAARSLAVLVGAFTACWMPYTICTVIIAFCDQCVHKDVYEAFNWLLWANASLNPFLYAFTNKQFRLNYFCILRLDRLRRSSEGKITPRKNNSLESTSLNKSDLVTNIRAEHQL
ncbi:histamine H3 receptor-like [Liolophura sinensis]|uniref:histamine H3 receptor-like n=1 Tax=Liolophura sinensis TaxID=3198878 RepID=UPI00315899C3